MTVSPHINKAEFEATLEIIETSAKLQRMRTLADYGNVQAAWYYGNILLIGGWDERRMEVDYLRGKLLPETSDPRQDPYLLLPRDQYAAVHYHKIAASFPEDKQVDEISYSRGILGYCRKKIDIGYYGKGKYDLFSVKILEDYSSAAKPENVGSNPFIPYPYKRPEVKNSKTKIFGCLASMILKKVYSAMLITICLLFSFSFSMIILSVKIDEDYMTALITFNLIVLITVFIPLIIAIFVCKKYGINESMPICSCAVIKKSYQKHFDRLPEDCRTGADSFADTPLFIRNFHHIKQAIFAINFVASLIFIVSQLSGLIIQDYSVEYITSAWFVLVISIVLLAMDKKWCLVDRDCDQVSKPILIGACGLPLID